MGKVLKKREVRENDERMKKNKRQSSSVGQLLGYSYLLQEKKYILYSIVHIHYSLYVIDKREIAKMRLDLKSDTQDDILVFFDGSK